VGCQCLSAFTHQCRAVDVFWTWPIYLASEKKLAESTADEVRKGKKKRELGKIQNWNA